ncbi:MAG: 1-acyl-sn-glycerol-3-phosphate acyltransferase [Tannerellaceae bacterium]|nr:1-acyl-sn-glycerol-3-phosphate acyltransferase [Tannerellaceae bacterium]
MRKFISKCLLQIAGWRKGPIGEYVPKCVICVAPHTSNWDLVIGKLLYSSIGRKAHFLIKKEWFFFPLNFLFKWMGGIPVDRKRKTSVTDQMADILTKRRTFHLAITPEGTRKIAEDWKRGFYYIALKANVPIMLAYIDYLKKEVGIKGLFYPTGNVEADIQAIKARYIGVTGRHPYNFRETPAKR